MSAPKSGSKTITLDDVLRARGILEGFVNVTPMQHSANLSRRLGCDLYLKKENEQRTGSFKIRGALNKISSLSEKEKAAGVIACSAGNHAQGVALSASTLKVKSHIVMPISAPFVKVEATRDYGANIIQHGDYYDQAAEHARKLADEKGYTFIHPYEDPLVIAGQGTIGLEIMDVIPEVDTIIIPVGGGGLISGIATAMKAKKKGVKIIGVQTEAVPSMVRAFRLKKLEDITGTATTIADGIAVKKPSKIMYETYIRTLVDEMVTVNDDEIAEAVMLLLERAKSVVEGSGAVGLAAMLNDKCDTGEKVCVLLSGGNIDLNMISKILEQGLSQGGRLAHLSVVVADIPGVLSKITACLGMHKANILQVNHDRASDGLHLLETKIDFIIETRGHEHIEKIRKALKAQGIPVVI